MSTQQRGWLTREEMGQIREDITNGVEMQVLAERYGISVTSLYERVRDRLHLTKVKIASYRQTPKLDPATRQQRAATLSAKARQKNPRVHIMPWSSRIESEAYKETFFRIYVCKLHPEYAGKVFTWDERDMFATMAKETQGACECVRVMLSRM